MNLDYTVTLPIFLLHLLHDALSGPKSNKYTSPSFGTLAELGQMHMSLGTSYIHSGRSQAIDRYQDSRNNHF